MSGYTPGEQPAEPGIVKLNTNENPYPPSPRVAEALREFSAERLRLYPDPLCRTLRGAIAAEFGCDPAAVFAGNGSDEILALCTRAFVEDAGAVGYFDPSYSLYPVLADIRCAAKKPVELGPDFEWRMPTGCTASLFFLANPNAPTSVLYPRSEVESFCRDFDGVVLIDEAYVDFSSSHCMDLALRLENVLVMRTLSKSYSLAGLRVGYVVGAPPLIEALFKIKDSYNLSRLAQEIALAAVKDQPALRANVKKVIRTRGRLAAELAGLGFEVFPSATNFLWVKPPRLPARVLYQRLSARKILVRYFAGSRTGAYLRITVGADAQAAALLAALREILS
jgi:histidinol-phosphate aminotransferase